MNLIEVQLERSRRTTITFEPPCCLEYTIYLGDTDKQLGLVTYAFRSHWGIP